MSASNEQQQLSIPLTPNEWQIILAGLYELPLKHSGHLAAKLQQQLTEGAQQRQPPKPLKEVLS